MPAPSEPLTILLLSADHHRAHAAFITASAAAALGRSVLVFAMNDGCTLLRHTLPEIATPPGVATLATLIEATQDLGARLIACETGLRLLNIHPTDLRPGVETASIMQLLSPLHPTLSF